MEDASRGFAQYQEIVGQLWAVVVAQLAEQSLTTPEVLSLNTVIGKICIEHCLMSNALKRRK